MALVAACAGDLPPQPVGAPCGTDADCASERCATAAPGGAYCVRDVAPVEGYGCDADVPCPAGLVCEDLGGRRWCVLPGEVTCDPGYTRCGDACRHLPSDPDGCGACHVRCPDGAWCEAGACVCPPDRPDVCADRCVDRMQNADHCGACDALCAAPDNRCRHGQCEAVACPQGWLRCQGDSHCTTPADAVVQVSLTGAGPTEPVGTEVQLRASGSGLVEAWQWRLIDAPASSLEAAGETATLTLPLTGVYTVEVEPGTSARPVCRPAGLSITAVATSELLIELLWEGNGDLDLHVRRDGAGWDTAGDCSPAHPAPDWADADCAHHAVSSRAEAVALDGLAPSAVFRVGVVNPVGSPTQTATVRVSTAGPPARLVYQAVAAVLPPGHLWDVGSLKAGAALAVPGSDDWRMIPYP